MARDTLFIGHANPEDDEFTLWVQGKLINEGYKVECDKTFLIGGEEDYWKSLQNLLENHSAKYLLVLSKSAFKKQGIIDEWEQAKLVGKKNALADFIYILKVDDVDFDVRIGVPVRNHFRFDLSWATAFKSLNVKLEKDGVIKSSNAPLSMNAWLKNKYSTIPGVKRKEELHYSNWLGIDNLPDKIYFFYYINALQAEAVEKKTVEFPIIRHDKYIISFSEFLPNEFDEYDFTIDPVKRIDIATGNAFQKYESEEFPKYDDLKRFMVRLLKEVLFKFLVNRGLHVYEMANELRCFYYKKNQLEKDKVFFEYQGKPKNKVLVGDYFEGNWHFGLSTSVLLFPILCFNLNSHLIFSDDGQTIWESKKKIQKARKKKGKSFYNKEWRELMLAFLASLSDDKESISIPVTNTESLVFPLSTITFLSKYGYDEPSTDGRLVPLDYDEEPDDEEDFDDIEESDQNEIYGTNTPI